MLTRSISLGQASPLCRPSGALHHSPAYPGLTPGATLLARLSALFLVSYGLFDDPRIGLFSQPLNGVP